MLGGFRYQQQVSLGGGNTAGVNQVLFLLANEFPDGRHRCPGIVTSSCSHMVAVLDEMDRLGQGHDLFPQSPVLVLDDLSEFFIRSGHDFVPSTGHGFRWGLL